HHRSGAEGADDRDDRRSAGGRPHHEGGQGGDAGGAEGGRPGPRPRRDARRPADGDGDRGRPRRLRRDDGRGAEDSPRPETRRLLPEADGETRAEAVTAANRLRELPGEDYNPAAHAADSPRW